MEMQIPSLYLSKAGTQPGVRGTFCGGVGVAAIKRGVQARYGDVQGANTSRTPGRGRDNGGPAAGGGACEDVYSMKYARARVFCGIYAWYDLTECA
jgi:hypothetical protein